MGQRPWTPTNSDSRGSTAVIGVVILCGLVVLLAAAVGGSLLSQPATINDHDSAAISLAVDGETLTVTHDHGESLDVESLRMRVRVDGEPLAEQPPIPFFSASGFQPGPTGPFNSARDSTWEVGESASLTLAGTNSPEIESGSTVSVQFYQDDTRIATAETVAQ